VNWFKSREGRLGIVLVCILAGVMVDHLAIKPGLERQRALRRELADLRVRWSRIKADLAMQHHVQICWEEIKGQLVVPSSSELSEGRVTNKTSSDEQQLARFTRELADLYDGLAVQIDAVTIMPIVSEEHYRKLSVQLVMEGSIREILNFLVAVAQTKSPLRLHRIQLSCKDRPDYLRASFALSKIVLPSE